MSNEKGMIMADWDDPLLAVLTRIADALDRAYPVNAPQEWWYIYDHTVLHALPGTYNTQQQAVDAAQTMRDRTNNQTRYTIHRGSEPPTEIGGHFHG